MAVGIAHGSVRGDMHRPWQSNNSANTFDPCGVAIRFLDAYRWRCHRLLNSSATRTDNYQRLDYDFTPPTPAPAASVCV